MSVSDISVTGAGESLLSAFTKINTNLGYQVCGDGAAALYLRAVTVAIKDGTTASTIKPSVADNFNGTAVAEENNLGISGDTGNFSLDATKSKLHIDSTATGDISYVLLAIITENGSGNIITVNPSIETNGITLEFLGNDATAYDLTAAVDVGEIYVSVLYLTAS